MASWEIKQDSAPYEIVEFIISGIIPVVLIVIGTFGNLLSIIILLKKENRRISTSVYLIFLCIVDTLSLYQYNLRYLVFEFTQGKQKIGDQSLFLCKWGQFLAFYTLHTSAMFLTLVALDRACFLWSEWYKRKIAQARVALTFCVIILLVLFALDGYLFEFGIEVSTYVNSTGIQQTYIVCSGSMDSNIFSFYANQYPWIHLVVMYFIPFTLMFICTLLTIKKLINRQTIGNGQLARNAQRNRRISIMLLLMCFTYVILTVPNRLCFSVFPNQIIGHEYTDIVFLASNTLMYIRNTTNIFFLYISVHIFRRDMRQLLLKCRGKLTRQVAPQRDQPATLTPAQNVA